MKFSVILASYNRAPVLKKILKSLAKIEFPSKNWELLLVNNNSTDDTDLVMTSFIANYPSINTRYIEEKKQGKSFASNAGINDAHHAHIIFIDDDMEIPAHILKTYEKLYRKYPTAAVIGGRIDIKISGALHNKHLLAPELSWMLGGVEYGNKSRQLVLGEAILAGNMSLNLNTIPKLRYSEDVGRMYKGVYIYSDDVELCTRMILNNKIVIYSPDITTINVVNAERLKATYILKRQIMAGVERRVLDVKFGQRKIYVRYDLLNETKSIIKSFFRPQFNLRWQWQRITGWVAFNFGYYFLGEGYMNKDFRTISFTFIKSL